MTAAVLMNLGFAGGSAALQDSDYENLIRIEAEQDTIYLRKWAYEPGMKTIYMSHDDVRRVVCDWSDWLGSSTIASVTWTTDPTSLTVSNTSNTNTAATAYLTAGGSGLDQSPYRVDVKIITADAVARTEERSFLVRIVRKWA